MERIFDFPRRVRFVAANVAASDTVKGSPAATTPIPLLRASLSFIVKQPGGLGYKLHSKCSHIQRNPLSMGAMLSQRSGPE